MKTRSPNEILQIPRDASPAEIVAAVTARTAHFRELSTHDSVQALAEIYQAAAFLLWETKHDPGARTTAAPTVGSTTPSAQHRIPAVPRRKRPHKTKPALAPLLMVAPTLAVLAIFLLYPDETMSAAWKLVDQAANAREVISWTPEPTAPAISTPTMAVIPTAGSVVLAPAAVSNAKSSTTPVSVPTQVAPNETPMQVEACVTISSLNVRAGPGIAYPSKSYLLRGECVNLTAQNQAGTWGIIRSTPRQSADSGWVSLAYMESDRSMRELPVANPPAVPSPTPKSTN